MTTVLSDQECRRVARLVENELGAAAQDPESYNDDYIEDLEALQEKVSNL